jgi:hypothetical protein
LQIFENDLILFLQRDYVFAKRKAGQ